MLSSCSKWEVCTKNIRKEQCTVCTNSQKQNKHMNDTTRMLCNSSQGDFKQLTPGKRLIASRLCQNTWWKYWGKIDHSHWLSKCVILSHVNTFYLYLFTRFTHVHVNYSATKKMLSSETLLCSKHNWNSPSQQFRNAIWFRLTSLYVLILLF